MGHGAREGAARQGAAAAVRVSSNNERVLKQAAAQAAAARAAGPRIVAGLQVYQADDGRIGMRWDCDPATAALFLDLAIAENLRRIMKPAGEGPSLVVAGEHQVPPAPAKG